MLSFQLIVYKVIEVKCTNLAVPMDEGSIDIRETLSLQLAEVEMLQSMFATDGEFVLDDQTAVPDIRSLVDGATEQSQLHSRIRFTLKLLIGDIDQVHEWVMNFTLSLRPFKCCVTHGHGGNVRFSGGHVT